MAAAPAAEQVAAWQDVDQAAAAPESPRSVLVRRESERVAQGGDQFDPFEAEMPATEPVAAPAPSQPAYDPFDDAATEAAGPPPISPNSFPAPSLEEAFEEPTIEPPPADEPAVDNESSAVEELEQAKQAIDRELLRRETERGLGNRPEAPDAGAQNAADPEPETVVDPEVDAPAAAAPPALEERPGSSQPLIAPTEPDIDAPSPPAEETDETEPYELPERNVPERDDRGLPYGGAVEPLPPPTAEQLERRRQQIEQERLESLAECDKLYDAVRADSIKNISLDIRQQGLPGEDFPFACEGRRPQFQPRNWAPVTYMWKASGLCHKPLYFEQVQLERYGHDWGPVLQPFVSGAHFFGTIPILPYKMGLQTPNECDYALGYYRPGSCAPYMIEPLGFTWRAAAFQAGAVTGAAFAIP
ncbi:hypothetical protein I41_44900 [Lacipirellula limnantheis]|uniref:Uncharacterized protein n=1 Tax=Lacipirellula limnantheis TaxID=2528024 RepID=A0A517U3S7_9BACT|nr:hypothetical protein I41_44900 [Lacipirellula limnantheis]